jgi:geranylgeranyl diphosphate synthase type II
MKQFEESLKQIESELSSLSFPKEPENLYDPLRYFLTLGGKRIRPVLTLMGASLFGINPDKALNAALAVEVFHNFSLIHDDIMDEAPLRRNKPTVHEQWGQNVAILSGDVLLVKAYQLLAQQDPAHLAELLKLFNATAVEVCEGQQMDMDFEKRSDVSIPEYIEMIRLKTSVLLGCALELGAIVADASLNDRKHLYAFGEHIGIAFQIQDDILDLFADPEKFGKQVGGDVIANKKTLLNLKALEMASGEQLSELTELATEPDLKRKVARTRAIYEVINVRNSCEEMMQAHYQTAMAALEKVERPDEAKNGLILLADFLMNREH